MQSLPIVQKFRRSQRLQLAAAAATCDLMPGQAVVQRGDVIDAWRLILQCKVFVLSSMHCMQFLESRHV